MQTAIPMAPPKPQDTPAKGTSSSSEGALFDFDDLQALRDEYEERIARLEREKVATLDVLKKDTDSRFATMQRDYESRLQNEAASRQDLIHELTFELAAAREDGERRAQEADKRRIVVEQQLHGALTEISRIEGDVARLKESLMRALNIRPAPPQEAGSPSLPSPSSPPSSAVQPSAAPPSAAPQSAAPPSPAVSEPAAQRAAPPPLPADDAAQAGPSASLAAFAPGKKKKIRLR